MYAACGRIQYKHHFSVKTAPHVGITSRDFSWIREKKAATVPEAGSLGDGINPLPIRSVLGLHPNNAGVPANCS